jgi:hypothetical protein
MRKFGFYLLALILVAAAAAAIVLATRNFKSHNDKINNAPVATNKAPSPKNACTIFSLADAKQLLGDNAKGGSNPVSESSSDFDVSTCTYTQDQGNNAPVASRKSATLQVQAPKTDIGIASNQREFGPLRPTNAEDVAGYGDQAYWDPEHGQLNILKNNIWYILSFGPSTPAGRTLDQAKQLADLISAKL